MQRLLSALPLFSALSPLERERVALGCKVRRLGRSFAQALVFLGQPHILNA